LALHDKAYRLIDSQLLWSFILMAMAVAIGLFISKAGLIGIMLVVAVLPAVFYTVFLFKYPIIGLFTALNFAFIVIGIIRYVPAPLGIAMDGFLFLSMLIVLSKAKPAELAALKSLPFYVFGIWLIYTILQVINPQAPSFAGWVYAVRGTSFNFFFIIVLTLMLISEQKHLRYFIYIWMGWSLIALLWGLKQKFVGIDGAERAWLDAGNASTHILHGKLRVFSFYSDAGQFGAAMAHAALFALILTIGPGSFIKKAVYATLGLLFLYGMAISGTRGAFFVLVGGGFIYLLVSRNFMVLTLGILAGGLTFGILKYTYIGQGNYEIQRLRSALNPKDASLNVRKLNQQKLARYLADKPFGGGIGTSGYFGLRFSPNSLLAQTATDSWFVRIWAETGIVGLFIHLGGLLLLIAVGFFKIFTLHDPALRNLMGALLAGFAGIVLASYGNSLLGQFPTSIVCMMSIGIIWKSKNWDKTETGDSTFSNT
jgi:hypothetical protein